MPEKKTDTKKQTIPNTEQLKNAVSGQLHNVGQKTFEAGQKAFTAVSGEVVEFEKKIMQLPVDRRIVFFVGVIMIISVFLDAFGKALLVLVGIGMIVAGYKGNDIFVRFLDGDKKKK